MIRSFFIATVCLFSTLAGLAQSPTVQARVDERVELMSVVCRLAGYEEFSQSFDNNHIYYGSPEYLKEVDTYFAKYKTDSLIEYAKSIRKKHAIAYDAPMTYAVCIEVNDGLKFIPELANGIEELDKRWSKESASKFLVLLNKFYISTNFHDFFEQHSHVYSKMEANFNSSVCNINYSWFEKFYGAKSNNSFSIILSCLNGDSSYGPGISFNDRSKKTYSIIGPWAFDSTLAVPDEYRIDLQHTLIHEFSHSYCNPLIFKYMADMESNSAKMFKCVKSEMNEQAYGSSKIMMCELLVRSCVIKYMEDNTSEVDDKVCKALLSERHSSFFWIDTVFAALHQYENKRSEFPTLDSYMPEMVSLINSLETKAYLIENERNRPDLHIKTSIINGDNNVSPDTKKLVVSFDRKMDTDANGTTSGKKGKKYHPAIAKAYWNMDNQQEWVLDINLEPGRTYSIAFPYDFFRDTNGYPGKKGVYYLDFKTKKE